MKQPASRVDLSQTHPGNYRVARPFVVRAIWLVVEAIVLLNPLVTSYWLKRRILCAFGAKIGRGLVIKPGVHIKYPWHLVIGDNCWIGERAWIDNFVDVRIGSNVCISQGAYLCTGNHDWSDIGMPLVVKPIEVQDGAWVAAFAKIAPGLTIGSQAVVTLGAVLCTDADAGGIYTGNPAQKVGERRIKALRAA